LLAFAAAQPVNRKEAGRREVSMKAIAYVTDPSGTRIEIIQRAPLQP
jgi:hypothetical protein